MGVVRRSIVAAGVNVTPVPPSWPERDRVRYTARPATAGGSPIRALKATITTDRPGKRASASAAPAGRPIRHETRSAVSVTPSDRATISPRTASPLRIRVSAAVNALSCGMPLLSCAHYPRTLDCGQDRERSEEHTSELQSLM